MKNLKTGREIKSFPGLPPQISPNYVPQQTANIKADSPLSLIAPVSGPAMQRTTTGMLTPYDNSGLYKAIIPEWLYKPVFGKPRNVNLPELRRLAKTPHVKLCINTIVTEVCSIPWQIQPKDPEHFSQAHIDEITAFLEKVNVNGEDFEMILRQYVQDTLELDSGVWVKIFDQASYYADERTKLWLLRPPGQRHMVAMKAYDGMNFTKNPDSYGILPEQYAYWQYYGTTCVMPTVFARDEIVYNSMYPQTSSGTYGQSPVEILYDIAQSLLYSVNYLKEFYSNNSIPDGVLSIIEGDNDTIDAFKAQWTNKLIRTDELGNKRRFFHELPIVNAKAEFTPITLSMKDMQTLESQQWWLKIVFATFLLPPTEAGFTEDANRSIDLNQSETAKRKAVKPYLNRIEKKVNTEVINEFGYDDVEFKFVSKDLMEERRRKEIAWQEVKIGAKTINDYRAEFGEDEDSKAPVEWGDKPYNAGGSLGGDIGAGMDQLFRAPGSTPPAPPEGFKSWEDAFTEWESGLKTTHTGQPVAKALSASTGGAGTAGSALVPVTLERGLDRLTKEWFDERMKTLLDELQGQTGAVKGKKAVQGKAGLESLIQPIVGAPMLSVAVLKAILERLEAFLMPSDNMRLQIGELARKAYMEAHDKAERQLDMNVDFTPEAIAQIQEMTFNDVVGMSKDIATDLRREFHDGVMKGESIPQLAKRVKSVFDVTDARATNIARTTMTKAVNTARMNAYEKSGVVDKVQWLTAGDHEVCPTHCKPLENKVFNLGEAPRPATDTHPQCRCQLIPYFTKEDKDNG